jgi:hypothetical protein
MLVEQRGPRVNLVILHRQLGADAHVEKLVIPILKDAPYAPDHIIEFGRVLLRFHIENAIVVDVTEGARRLVSIPQRSE